MMTIIAAGITAQAQTLILSDSFDTGGVATNDLNYNQGVRQAGTVAPMNYTVNTNAYPISLTAAGKLNMKSDGPWYSVVSDPIGTQLGSESFSIKWNTQHAASSPDGNWSMISVLSAINNNWDNSPMTVNLWSMDFIHLDYGSSNNLTSGNNLRIDMSPGKVAAAIGAAYNADDVHDFELRACAKSATSGTWGFYIDGTNVAAGLPYTFEDSAKRLNWNANHATDADWDDLEISTIPAEPAKEYVFFDDFNGTEGTHAGWLYSTRQTNGMAVTSYGQNYNLFAITNRVGNGKLNDYWPSAYLATDVDLGSYILGKDFELSCKVAVNTPGGEWTSFYLDDEDGKDRGNSRLGMYIPGTAQPWACVLYYGTGAAQTIKPIDPAWYAGLAGYDKTQEHTFKFVSTAGTGGTNSYEVFIDGVEITDSAASGGNAPDSLPYYFDKDVRKIAIVGSIPDGTDQTNGAFYDDVYLKVIKGASYEDWVADDTGLTPGVNDGRADDPDGDLMDNLLEYALGGDPLVDDAATILPLTDYSVTDSISYVFRRRVDASARRLTYDVLLNVDGLQLPWTNVSNAYETGSSLINTDFEAVTNTFDISTADFGFVNLEVTED